MNNVGIHEPRNPFNAALTKSLLVAIIKSQFSFEDLETVVDSFDGRFLQVDVAEGTLSIIIKRCPGGMVDHLHLQVRSKSIADTQWRINIEFFRP